MIQNTSKLQQFCHEVCRKLLIESEVKSPRELEDYMFAFERFIEDKKYLESVYIKFKQDVLKAMLGEKEKYEPLTALEIIEMVANLKWKNNNTFEFEQVRNYFIFLMFF